MRTITVYEANDGSRWDTPDAAVARDALIVRCASVAAEVGLKAVPKSTGFANGGGYVQQPRGSKAALLDALRDLGANRDSDGPVGKLLCRAWCIDDQDREWGQPYFALNPGQAEMREIA